MFLKVGDDDAALALHGQSIAINSTAMERSSVQSCASNYLGPCQCTALTTHARARPASHAKHHMPALNVQNTSTAWLACAPDPAVQVLLVGIQRGAQLKFACHCEHAQSQFDHVPHNGCLATHSFRGWVCHVSCAHATTILAMHLSQLMTQPTQPTQPPQVPTPSSLGCTVCCTPCPRCDQGVTLHIHMQLCAHPSAVGTGCIQTHTQAAAAAAFAAG